MRVLQIYDHVGMNCGIMSVVMNWYRNIDRTKIQFDFLVSYKKEPSYEAEIRKLGGRVFYMSERETLELKAVPEIIKNSRAFLKEYGDQYSIAHLHTLTFAFPYLIYAKKYGVQVRISHAHSIALGNTPLKCLRNKVMAFPAKVYSNVFIACTDIAGKRCLAPLGIEEYKVIPNGIDFERYHFSSYSKTEIRKALGFSDKTIYLIHVSNMTEIKNVPFTVRVFSKILEYIPDSKLVLVGKNELPIEVQNEIKSRGLVDKVVSLGVRNDIPELLHASDLCLMPSFSEGFGLVAVEAQLAGLPVLTSKGFPEDIFLTELAQSENLDEHLWVSKALEMIRVEKQYENIQTSLKCFDIRNIVDQISNIYLTIGD